jgi:hypothetical protein
MAKSLKPKYNLNNSIYNRWETSYTSLKNNNKRVIYKIGKQNPKSTRKLI